MFTLHTAIRVIDLYLETDDVVEMDSGIGGFGLRSASNSGHTVGKGKATNLYREVLDEYLDINWNEVNDEPNDAGEDEEAYSFTESNDEEWVGEKDVGGGRENSSDGEFIIMEENEDDGDEGLSDCQSDDEPDPYSSGEEQDVEC